MLGMTKRNVMTKLEFEMRSSLGKLKDRAMESVIEDLIGAIGTVIEDNNDTIRQEIDRLYEQTRHEIARHHLE